MRYLLFAGAPNTGKTESVNKLAEKLIKKDSYTVIAGKFPDKNSHFQCILQKEHKKVLLHSYTDTPDCIKKLKRFYTENQDVDIIITSIRDIEDKMRRHLENEMRFSDDDMIVEIPLGRITRRWDKRNNCIIWYLDNIQKIVQKIITSEPFNL